MLSPSTPCALRNRLHNDDRSSALSSLECQSTFQHWVAFDRNASSDIFDKEHLICPLLWCRKRFDNLGSCLQHLTNCPWLPNAWYWCPYCHRPESFIASRSTENTDNVQHRMRRKQSKFKRATSCATSFFRRFGRKNASLIIDLPPPYESECWNKCELDGRSNTHLETSSARGTLSKSVHKLQDIHDDSNVLSVGTHAPSYRHDINELHGSAPFYDLTQYETPVAELQDCHHPTDTIGNENCVYPYVETNMNNLDARSVVSPLSQIDTCHPSFTDDWAPLPNQISPIEWDYSGLGPLFPTENRVPTISLPTVVENDVPSDDGLLTEDKVLGETLGQKLTVVRYLSELVHVLNDEWMQRLKPILDQRMMGLIAANNSPFESGLRALQQFHRGVLPSTFGDAFSLMHIAFASVYIFHHADSYYPWHKFSQDVTNWVQAIVEDSDRCLFLRVADILWSAPVDSNLTQGQEKINTSTPIYTDSPSSLPQLHQISPTPGLEGSFSFPIYCNAGPPSQDLSLCQPPSGEGYTVNSVLFDELKNGQVMKVCSQYLDYIEYTAMCERIGIREPCLSLLSERALSNIEMMDALIIQPLLQFDQHDLFHNHILNTQSYLRDGLLHSIREVEVQLIVHQSSSYFPNHSSFRIQNTSSCQITRSSHSVYDEYSKTVSSLCDRVALDPSWRDGYYAMDLDRVLEIYSEVKDDKSPDYSLDSERDTDPTSTAGYLQLPYSQWPASKPLSSRTGLVEASPSTDTSFSTSDNTLSASSDTSFSFSEYLPSASSHVSYHHSNFSSPTQGTQSPHNTWSHVNDSNYADANAKSFAVPKSPASSHPPCTPTKSSKLKLVIPPTRGALQLSTRNPSPLRCSICDTPFTGNYRDQLTNLKRHSRNTHGRLPPLICTEPQCGKQYQRSDNLRKHRSVVHGLKDPVRKRKRNPK